MMMNIFLRKIPSHHGEKSVMYVYYVRCPACLLFIVVCIYAHGLDGLLHE